MPSNPGKAFCTGMPAFSIRPLVAGDRAWVAQFTQEHWGAELVVTSTGMYRPAELPGFIAEIDDEKVGLVTFRIQGPVCEIVTLDSLREGMGIGTALVEAVKRHSRESGCKRLVLTTTNDNLRALRFYQKRGFVLAALHTNVLQEWRLLKPEIPLYGIDGIPLRDALELEMEIA